MAATIAALYRYPVKGLSPEPLDRVALSPGECLPQDRRFAIALPSTEFDPDRPQWLAKTHFVMLMRDAKLAELRSRYDAESGAFSVERGAEMVLQARLTEDEGRREAAAFFTDFMAGAVEGPLRIVEAPGHAFADARRKPNASTDKYVSLINRASIAALEQAVGRAVNPLRFRANVYFDGPPAWAELDWLERAIRLGPARLRVIAAITRCAATAVNPASAERDLDVVAALRSHFGHNLMGVYAEVAEGGTIAVGHELAYPSG